MAPANATLSHLHENHGAELQRFARRRVGRQEAEDVVQEAYLHFLQRSVDAPLDQPRAYLFRIAANVSVDYARRARTRTAFCAGLNDEEPLSTPEALIFGFIEVRRLDRALARLPKPQRDAFLLKRLEGLTHTEIAERLNLSVRTVDRYLEKAAALLCRQVGQA